MRPRVTSVGLLMPSRPAEAFEYPSHIDHDSLTALPPKPGVYFFRNRSGRPIYIGKSINLRSRVLAHLRTPEESMMLAETRRVDFVRTAGEIGALLLESQLIKRYQPAYNVLLKFAGISFGLTMNGEDKRLLVVGHGNAEVFDRSAKVHGLFASRSEAEQGLRALIRQHQLCPALLKMETTTLGRACFSHQIGHCRGACIGRESQEAHWQRLQMALDLLDAAVWPYGGPIAIVERDENYRQAHIVYRWMYVGSLEGRRRKINLPEHQGFDIDTYKILARTLDEDRLRYVNCAVKPGPANSRQCVVPAFSSLRSCQAAIN